MVHLFGLISNPIVWVLSLMALGLVRARCLRRKPVSNRGWSLVIAAALLLYLFSIPPVSRLLVYSLECKCRLPQAEVLSTLDLVAILGSGYYPSGRFREHHEPMGVTYSRVFNGVKAFKQSGAETLALCGGGSGQTPEAEVMRSLAIELGVEENRIMTEVRSRNTMDNATGLAKLLPPDGKRRIGLVTSAVHMPRSESVFRKIFP